MIYKTQIGDLDLGKLTRLYPAAVVETQGQVAEMSPEWIDLYSDKVKLLKYVLVFDFTPLNEETKDRKTLEFATREELVVAMTEVAQLFPD